MGGIIKFAMFLFLAMVFFTPPEEANALKCMICYSGNQTEPCFLGKVESTLCKPATPPFDICVSETTTLIIRDEVRLSVFRKCAYWKENNSRYQNITMDKCDELHQPYPGPEGREEKSCICCVDGCNSGIAGSDPGPNPNPGICTTSSSTNSVDPGTGTTLSSTNSMYLTGSTMFQLLIISFGVIIQCFTQ